MKRIRIILVLTLMAGMSSCLVSSLHPFFKKEDKHYQTVMEGSWLDSDSCLWTIEPNISSKEFMGEAVHDSSYLITYYEEADKASHLVGTLFRLNGVDYVDFTADPNESQCITDMTCYHHVPVHTLARVRYCSDSILLFWYGEDWLQELFEENRIRIRHETIDAGYERQVLTADTDELQKFIRKYADHPKTVEKIENIFAIGTPNDEPDFGVFLKLKPLSD